MAMCTAPLDLPALLEEHCARVRRPRFTVLFRRGEKAFGAFIVFKGKVSLDWGDETLARSYGPGALVGLPATLTKRDYVMTATVIEDTELGFLPPQTLESLMKTNSDFCQGLLRLLSERMLEIQQAHKAVLQRGNRPSCEALPAFLDREASSA
jgi:CRP-like cAMP-binding protein